MTQCPCKGCERAGCGSYHDECERYQEWSKELQATRKWLGHFVPFMCLDRNRELTKVYQRKAGRNV